jgi:hypothetical protein
MQYRGFWFDNRGETMRIEEELEKLERERNNMRFDYLARVCQERFGNPRFKGSHQIFKTPWPGDPRINLQKDKGNKGKAKPYQVKQVIAALRKLQEMEESRKKEETHRAGEEII